MTKFYVTIIILVLSATSNAQSIPILTQQSMKSYSGEADDIISIYDKSNTGYTLRLESRSLDANFNVYCASDVYSRSIFYRYSGDGASLSWERCYQNTKDSNVAFAFKTSSNEMLTVGTKSTPASNRNIQVIREDMQGNILWNKTFGGSGDEIVRKVVGDNSGGYIIIAESNSPDGDVGIHYGSLFTFDIWALRIDQNGEILWKTVLGGSYEESCGDVIFNVDESCFIVGTTLSDDLDCVTKHPGLSDILVAAIDQNGSKKWTKCFGGSKAELGSKCISSIHGNLLVGGSTFSDDGDVKHHIGNQDYWVVEVGSGGDLIWEQCFGGIYNERLNDISISSLGDIWIVGNSGNASGQVYANYSQSNSGNAFVVKATSSGNFLASKVMGSYKGVTGTIINCLSNGITMSGGVYYSAGPSDGGVPNVHNNLSDSYITYIAPWTTDITNVIEKGQFAIYPNPTNSYFNVFSKSTRQYKVDVINILGETVICRPNVENQLVISTSDWPSGIYMVKITDDSNISQTHRIVVKH